MSSERLIAISGKSGCGNTTVSRLAAAGLGLRVINYTFKDLARERGIAFEELARRAEEDPQYDRAIDDMQVQMAKAAECVLGSRLAIWLLRERAFTVYLAGSLEARALRIAKREGLSFETALTQTTERDRRDRERYLRLYGIDVDQYAFASLVIDTETMDPKAEAHTIIEKAQEAWAAR